MIDFFSVVLFLDFFGELFGDINLIIKLFALMTIISWVRNHVGDSPLSWIIIIGLGYFILFDGWKIFGPVYVLYSLLMFGISAVIIDFFFVGAGGPPERDGLESPVSTGVDIANRMHGAHQAQQSAGRMMRR